jgi:hypothetical protein
MILTKQFSSTEACCHPLDDAIDLLIASQFLLVCGEFRAKQDVLMN